MFGLYLLYCFRVFERQIGSNKYSGYYPSAAPLASTVKPSGNSMATLVSMGFDRNSARHALVQARSDVNVATNILLEAQSH
ncbi:hypothetical protein IFM89_012797 [Coptis chinensis]|uniref:UBA domain-containing protein n=1 Tax=Coptis chinensis TaxID=261450 RepID=A0A835H401_9MAGN|nr:hypothetical protein IFM89_012797 [Coptis chinensis]